MDDSQSVTNALVTSRIFRAYASAFQEVTGIGLCVEAVRTGAPSKDAPNGQENSPVITTLPGGKYTVAIPIQDGARAVALIRTGVICEEKTGCCGEGFPGEPVRSKAAAAPILTLLSIFADQLAGF